MPDQFVYRFDSTEAFQKIFVGDCHRARRHVPGARWVYRHKLLEARLEVLPSSHAIYRICFWMTLDLCLAEIRKFSPEVRDAQTVTRCRVSELVRQGFTEIEDDGLPGKAYLFWVEEEIGSDNQVLSNASIPFAACDVYLNGEWIALPDHLRPRANEPVNDTQATAVTQRQPNGWFKGLFSRSSRDK